MSDTYRIIIDLQEENRALRAALRRLQTVPERVWVLVAEEDEYDTRPEVVGVYATETLAKGEAQARAEAPLAWKAVDTEGDDAVSQWEADGTMLYTHPHPWDKVHAARHVGYRWEVTRYPLATEAVPG